MYKSIFFIVYEYPKRRYTHDSMKLIYVRIYMYKCESAHKV